MEMKTIMKNRSSISEANIPRCRHRHRNKYTRHKKSLDKMMSTRIK